MKPTNIHFVEQPMKPTNIHYVEQPMKPTNIHFVEQPMKPTNIHYVEQPMKPTNIHYVEQPMKPTNIHFVEQPMKPTNIHYRPGNCTTSCLDMDVGPEYYDHEKVVLNNSLLHLNGTSLYNFSEEYLDYDYVLDYSQFDYLKPLKAVPLLEAVIKVAVYSNIIVLSAIGNVLIILVVIWNKQLRTTTNFYIVNLAVSDLLVTLGCSWVHVVDDLTEGWVLGTFFCKFNSFAQVASLVSSVMSLTLIACDRFFGIVFAMKAHIIERRACHSILVIWIISLAMGAPMLVVRTVLRSRQWRDHLELWCEGEWEVVKRVSPETGQRMDHRPGRVAYLTVITIVMFFLPMLIMLGTYVGIIKTLWQAKVPGERLSSDVKVETKVKRKVVMMLVLIMVVFFVCWFPLQFSVLYDAYRPNQNTPLDPWYNDFTFFAKLLAFSNSAMNPVIYAGFNNNFRKGFKIMFGCYKKQRYTTLSKMDDSSHSATGLTMTTTHCTRM
ncbi:QRFP-like peptide receptor [Argopecten irradians]|uniref:QRFP-like peptide receptor n=1 Tax=Argopecten irradians TaxID=31199 RepID=UPI003713892B